MSTRSVAPLPSASAAAVAVALVVAGLLGGCAGAPAPTSRPPEARGSAPTPPLPVDAPEAAPSGPATEIPDSVHWVRNSAEYRAAVHQVYNAAARTLESLVAKRQPDTWAVALDADETVIDNSPYQKERSAAGLGFTRESWWEWVRRQEAAPLPGAIAFLERVHALGGRIAIVTNRYQDVCPETEENLRQRSIPFDVVLCRPSGGASDKEPRWALVEEGRAFPGLPPLDIVLWVGDNIQDFPGLEQDLRFASPDLYNAFGSRYWIIPNPMYGSWEGNPRD